MLVVVYQEIKGNHRIDVHISVDIGHKYQKRVDKCRDVDLLRDYIWLAYSGRYWVRLRLFLLCLLLLEQIKQELVGLLDRLQLILVLLQINLLIFEFRNHLRQLCLVVANLVGVYLDDNLELADDFLRIFLIGQLNPLVVNF